MRPLLRPFALGLLVALCHPLPATSFFAYDSGDALYIGGDTLIGLQGAKISLPPTCKMITSQQYVVLVAGNVGGVRTGSPDGSGPYVFEDQVIDAADGIMQQAGAPGDKIEALTGAAVQLMSDSHAKHNANGGSDNHPLIVQLYVFWWEDGKPFWQTVSVGGEMKGGQFEVTPYPIARKMINRDEIRGFAMGSAINDPRFPAPGQFRAEPTQSIGAALSLQHTLTPTAVGPPFTIFKLTANGGSWVSEGGLCEKYSHLD